MRSAGEISLLVTDPEKLFSFPDDALRALYRFTPAESEIANGLLMDYTRLKKLPACAASFRSNRASTNQKHDEQNRHQAAR